MTRKVVQLSFLAFLLVGLFALAQTTPGQTPQAAPPPAKIRPNYNYSEAYRCAGCHATMGAGGVHNAEAVGVLYDKDTTTWSFTGNGWLAAKHSQSNYVSTQNTYCAKCHSPLQATAEAAFGIGKSASIPDGQTEGVTCATCHPDHNAAVVLGRRLGIYQWGVDRAKPEAYKVVEEGNEDVLCLNCHTNRHNEGNPAFDLMYVAGVRCIDCHMAVYGKITGTEVDKRLHDWKVAKNLPYSCGVEGAVTHCHPEFSVEATRLFIPYLKDQHRSMWPKSKTTKRLRTAADYLRLWKQLQAGVQPSE